MLAASAAVLLCSPSLPAFAGGQFVGDAGAEGTQRAGAFVAKADDATALHYNPGGLALTEGTMLYIGANLVRMNLEFSRTGAYQNSEQYQGERYPTVRNNGPVQPIPFISLAHQVNPKLVLGGGLYAPQGYPIRDFPEQVTTASGMTAPAPQRYDAVTQQSRVVFPSIAAGYRLTPRLSVGVRLSWGVASINSSKYVQGIANSAENPATDSKSTLAVEDMFVPAAGVGFHYKKSAGFEIGASVNSPAMIRAKGTTQTEFGEALREPIPGIENHLDPVPDNEVRCAPGGVRGKVKSCLDLNLPLTAAVGARWIARDDKGNERGDIEVDVRFENWANASDYRIRVDGINSALGTKLNDTVIRHGFHNVFSVRVGASGVVPGDTPITVRVGMAYDSAAAPRSWTRLDVDGVERFTGSTGLGFTKGRYRIDIGMAYVASPRREVGDIELANTTDMSDRVQPDVNVPLNKWDAQPYHPINAGVYKSSYLIGSLGMSASW